MPSSKWFNKKAAEHAPFISQYIRTYPNDFASEIAAKILAENPSFNIQNFDNLQRVVSRVKQQNFTSPTSDQEKKKDGFTVSGSTRGYPDGAIEKMSNSPSEIKSLEDLVKFFDIDLTKWTVEKWECTFYESHTRIRQYDEDVKTSHGYARTDDIHKKVPLYRVWARLAPNKPAIDADFILDKMLSRMKKFSPHYEKIDYPQYTSPCMQEISIFDLHLGKQAWEDETGTEFNLEIAEKIFLSCLIDLIGKGREYNVEKILFPVGNDFFNADNYLNTTTSGRHVQDEDERWRKTFTTGVELIRSAIDLLQQIAPVFVPIIPGNHDRQRSQYLGYVLEGWYHNNPNVVIDNSPKLRKYVLYGNSLIGFTHGRDERLDDLPIMMANEAGNLYAQAKWKEWHVGDKHFKKEIKWLSTDEIRGVTVRRLRSLSGTDAWHYRKGYVSNVRAGESFIWDKENGLVCQFSANYHGNDNSHLLVITGDDARPSKSKRKKPKK